MNVDFGPCSRFWHPNLSTLRQAAKIADLPPTRKSRCFAQSYFTGVFSFRKFHTAMHSDRFLVAEIEIAESARCQTTRARTACSRYRRKLYSACPKPAQGLPKPCFSWTQSSRPPFWLYGSKSTSESCYGELGTRTLRWRVQRCFSSRCRVASCPGPGGFLLPV